MNPSDSATPKFSGGAIFNRDIPEGFRDEWALLLAKAKEKLSSGFTSVVVFRTNQEWLSLKTGYIQEIVEERFCHSIPLRSTDILLGLVNIGGELLPCLSLAGLLRLAVGVQKEKGKAARRMIVAGHGNRRYVFAVDEIIGIFQIPPSQFQPVPATLAQSPINLVDSIFSHGTDRVGLLHAEKLLDSMERSLRE